MNKIFRLIMGTITIQFVLLFIYMAWSHMIQLAMPRAYWYSYNSVTPSKTWYMIWEGIYWVSDTIRRHPIETQRQDTLFCDNGIRTQKYPTQFRPPTGREIPKLWNNKNSWLYDYPILVEEKTCQLCGTVVAETDYWYNKNYQYCTDWFEVNLNNTTIKALLYNWLWKIDTIGTPVITK